MSERTLFLVERIVLIRNIFYRAFAIAFALYILSIIIWMGFPNWASGMTEKFFAGISKHEVLLLMVYFIGWMKLIHLYLFLIPALALHWTGAVLKKELTKD